MSYATTANRPNPAAALGALGIPAGIGALLIIGLAVKYEVVPILPNPVGENIEVVELDPVIEPDPIEQTTQPSTSTVTTIESEIVLPTPPRGEWETNVINDGPVSTLPGLDDIGDIGPVFVEVPPAPPLFDPISAAPRGNTSRWITDNDYRSSWINRGLEGVAGFTLRIDTDGRVTNCAITQSTGHSQLDTATCRLLRDRARFTPARDSSGAIVAGSYSSSVAWEIP